MKSWYVEEKPTAKDGSFELSQLGDDQRVSANPNGTPGTCLVWTEMPVDESGEVIPDPKLHEHWEQFVNARNRVPGYDALREEVDRLRATTIELTDDVHQDEPSGYMVFAFNSLLVDYMVFPDAPEARRFAERQAEESGRGDWPIYPLYPTHPIELSEFVRIGREIE